MLPKRVRSPQRSTCMIPSPSVTQLPRNKSCLWSVSHRTGSSGRGAPCLWASRLSPDRAAWSHWSVPFRSQPSAGMPSPASRNTTSPSTSSSAGTSRKRPSLRTRQVVLAASCWRRTKAFSLLYSDKVEISDAARMARAMPTVSNQPWPRNRNSRLTARAASRILMMGSLRFSSSFAKKPARFRAERLLPRPRSSRLCTSCCRSPKERLVSRIRSLPVADLYKPMRRKDKVCQRKRGRRCPGEKRPKGGCLWGGVIFRPSAGKT